MPHARLSQELRVRFYVAKTASRLVVQVTCGDDEVLGEFEAWNTSDGRRAARAWVKAVEPDATLHRSDVLAALRSSGKFR